MQHLADEYKEYLENELSRCDLLHALCQEMAGLATSEMTRLEYRQEQLFIDLERLREIREQFTPVSSFPSDDYTPIHEATQERMTEPQS